MARNKKFNPWYLDHGTLDHMRLPKTPKEKDPAIRPWKFTIEFPCNFWTGILFTIILPILPVYWIILWVGFFGYRISHYFLPKDDLQEIERLRTLTKALYAQNTDLIQKLGQRSEYR